MRHALAVTLPSGEQLTIGPEELCAASIPEQISLDTELNGGYGPANITVPSSGAYQGYDPAALRLCKLRVYDYNTRDTVYLGRVANASFDANKHASIEAEGYSKHLEDDETAAEIFYDRDLSQWGSMQIQREAALLGFGIDSEDPGQDPDSATPSVLAQMTSPWSRTHISEAWYDAGPNCKVGALDYAWMKNANVNNADVNYSWQVGTSPDGISTTTVTSNLRAAGPGSGSFIAPDTAQRYALAQFIYSAASPLATGLVAKLWWTLLGVIGLSGVPLQGSVASPSTGRGVLASDVARNVVSRWATLLKCGPDSVPSTSLVIPHLAFKELTTARTMIDALIPFGDGSYLPLDWGVYENSKDEPEFFMKRPGSYGTTWRVRLDEATEKSSAGPDSSELCNGVVVRYDAGDGKTRTIGPPGSVAQAQTALLLDTDPNNPANNDGARHWKQYDAGICDVWGALAIGQIVLTDAKRQQWRGSVSIKKDAYDESGNKQAAAKVRAGDRVVIGDDPYDRTEKRITATSYDAATQTVEASVGTPPGWLDVVLARAGVLLTGRI